LYLKERPFANTVQGDKKENVILTSAFCEEESRLSYSKGLKDPLRTTPRKKAKVRPFATSRVTEKRDKGRVTKTCPRNKFGAGSEPWTAMFQCRLVSG